MILNRYISLFTIIMQLGNCLMKHVSMCPKGYFMVENMSECHPLLVCSDFRTIEFVKLIGYGSVKWVFLAKWNDVFLSVSFLKDEMYANDFREGVNVLKALSPNKYVTQLVGFCDRERLLATEYHVMNNANSLMYILGNDVESVSLSLNLCINYVEILNYIHNSPIGVRVNCDSDSVQKILSQLLVTEKITLVLNDVDALPEIGTNDSMTCGIPTLKYTTSLIPPELVDVRNQGYSNGYTHKSDIWKVPDVCNHIFSLANMNALQFKLFGVHKKCKHVNPIVRPSSKELVSLYKQFLRCT